MRINCLGCSLVDNLYSPVDFKSKAYNKWNQEDSSGNGIITGGLVFGEELERISGKKYENILKDIIGKKLSAEKNVGGPAIVALINIAQMTYENNIKLGFYGARADDENGRYIADKLGSFGINISGYAVTEGKTPFTDVLSDPSYNNYNGERSFINYIGAAGKLSGKDLDVSFFNADILIYGGTALTPGLHDALSLLLKKGKEAGCLNFVNTVYDFRNQNINPDNPWPLVDEDKDYQMIDLLIADNEEARRISGYESKEEALAYFSGKGVHSIIITHGSEDLICYSDGLFFVEKGIFTLPVSKSAGDQMRALSSESGADTTGCGDNFAGGVYASIALQLENNKDEKPSLKEAASWGVVSGGFAGLHQGGFYYEKKQGEKLEKLKILFKEYEQQTGWSELRPCSPMQPKE
ncbi:MAG: carbohydrate kinase family protein [Spirochaetales bacterium]|nr:carbohydrate kinase family protein [Spirochaetales bacterium]